MRTAVHQKELEPAEAAVAGPLHQKGLSPSSLSHAARSESFLQSQLSVAKAAREAAEKRAAERKACAGDSLTKYPPPQRPRSQWPR